MRPRPGGKPPSFETEKHDIGKGCRLVPTPGNNALSTCERKSPPLRRKGGELTRDPSHEAFPSGVGMLPRRGRRGGAEVTAVQTGGFAEREDVVAADKGGRWDFLPLEPVSAPSPPFIKESWSPSQPEYFWKRDSRNHL